MYKILVLLLLPLSLNGTVTYKELPQSTHRMSDLNAQFYFNFRSWEEMQEDADISVEQYRKYIGTRCAGLYDYLTEREKRNFRLNVSLENKVDFMEAVIKYNLIYMGREYIEINSKWVFINRIKFRDYYKSLYEHQDKYFVQLDSLSDDLLICERYYDINFFE
ncbi:hypothetical protein N9E52_01780 [Alphaproteobacteria bacterium]|nr:hypothetical protein [Alphaproteobacteria bacterium]